MWRSIDPCKSRETASIYFLLNLPAKAGQAYVLRRSPGLQILRAPFSARQESAVVPIQIEQGIGRSVLELAPDNAANKDKVIFYPELFLDMTKQPPHNVGQQGNAFF